MADSILQQIVAALMAQPQQTATFSERFPNMQGNGAPYTVDSMRGPLAWPSQAGPTFYDQFPASAAPGSDARKRFDDSINLRMALKDYASKPKTRGGLLGDLSGGSPWPFSE